MKGLIKLLLGLVALVVVLVVAGGAILGALFNPNDYKPQIVQLAQEKAGVTLKIDGEIQWSVFPWLGLELNQVSARFTDQPQLANLNKAQLAVRLPALLSGKVEMQSIVVDGLELNLVKTKAGSNNWTAPQLGADQPAGTAESTPSVPSTQAAAPAAPADLALDIESITLSNAQLSYADQHAGTRLELTDLQVQSGNVVSGGEFPIDLSFKAQQFEGDKTSARIDAKLTANALLDLANQRYQLKGLDSVLGLTAAALNNNTLTVNLKGDLASDLSKQSTSLNNLKLSVADLNLSGNVVVQDFAKPQLSGDLAIAPFALNPLLKQLGQPEVATTDPGVLKKISLNAQLGGKANTVGVEKLTLKLDDTTFTGNASYALATGNTTVNLSGDSLNADRYLPPASDTPTEAANTQAIATSDGPYSKEPVIPVEPFKTLELDATFKLAQLTVNKLNVSNVDLAVNAHNGLVNASKLNADLYGGTVRNKVTLDTRVTPVKVRTVKDIRNIQIGDVLQTAAQVDKLTGTLSSQSDVTTRGRSVHDIVHTMTGTAAVQMKDGEIKGIDMAQTLCQGMNTVGSLGLNTQQVDRSTPFADMSASTRIKNGVVSNKDLKAALDALALNGRGSVDLPKQALDYRLALVIEDNLFKKTCSIPDKLEGIEWPVDCKGSFDTEPAKLCKPDLSVIEDAFKKLAKDKAKAKIDKKKEELKEKLEQKLGDKLGGEEGAKQLLKGLFGN